MRSESPITAGLAVLAIAAVHLYVLTTARRKREQSTQQPDGLDAAVIMTFPDKATVSKNLCAFVARAANNAIAMRGVFHMAVAGGTLLDSLPGLVDYRDSVDFSKVVLSFVDHQCIDPYCDEAMLAQCRTKFTADGGIRNIVVPSPSPDEDGDGSRAATYYAKAMRDAGIPHMSGYPVFDLVVLGLGPGSCYQNGPGVGTSDTAAVTSTRKGSEPSTIALTVETINAAREVAIVAWDGTKAIKWVTSGSAKGHGILSALSKSPVVFVSEETPA